MILKIVLTVVVLVLLYLLLFKSWRSSEGGKGEQQKRRETGEETMQPCARCGTYVSVDEAILSNGRYFCSSECLEQKR